MLGYGPGLKNTSIGGLLLERGGREVGCGCFVPSTGFFQMVWIVDKGGQFRTTIKSMSEERAEFQRGRTFDFATGLAFWPCLL